MARTKGLGAMLETLRSSTHTLVQAERTTDGASWQQALAVANALWDVQEAALREALRQAGATPRERESVEELVGDVTDRGF